MLMFRWLTTNDAMWFCVLAALQDSGCVQDEVVYNAFLEMRLR